LLRTALETARALGMVALEGPIGALLGSTPEPAAVALTPAGSGQAIFRREGEYWSVIFDGHPVRIRDAKGMRYLARLLANPGQEQHALDLARMDDTEGARTSAHRDLQAHGIGDAGAMLDSEAKAAYRGRLDELQSEMAEAEAFNDPERRARAQQAYEDLTDELAAAVGLGGRDRKAASAAERARISVTRAIRSALGRISNQHPALGRHLQATIRTGTFCSYMPDPRLSIEWEL
jgi:hypothetical protein